MDVKQEFAIRKRKQLRSSLLALPFLVLLFLSEWLRRSEYAYLLLPLLFPTLILFFGVVAFSFKNWRCPACNRHLSKTSNPKNCPHCGVELRD